MVSSLCIKPHHVPVLLIVSLLMIAASDARVPKKHKTISEKARILHEQKKGHSIAPSDVIIFSKNLYASMGHENITMVAEDFQSKFDELDQGMNGRLAQTLGTLFEMKLMDLQQSVRHARAMLDVIGRLAYGSPPCPACGQRNATPAPE